MERSAAPEQGIAPGPSGADLFAYGVVVAVAAILLVDLRFDERWSAGTQLGLTGGAFAVVYALAARGGRPAVPPAHRSALLLAALALLGFALAHLTEVMGESEELGDTSIVWASAAFVVVAAGTGIAFRSAACTFVAAAAAGVLTIGLVATVIEPDGEEAYQWAAGVYFAVLGGGGCLLGLLGERRHSPQLVTAAAIGLILAGYGLGFFFIFDVEGEEYGYEAGWAFEALLTGGSLLVLAFGLFFRQRGPSWAGAIALVVAIGTLDGKATLVVWPVALLGVAVLLMLAGAVRARAARG